MLEKRRTLFLVLLFVTSATSWMFYSRMSGNLRAVGENNVLYNNDVSPQPKSNVTFPTLSLEETPFETHVFAQLAKHVTFTPEEKRHLITASRQKWTTMMAFRSEKNFESLFHKVNILDEMENALIGSPLEPLPKFKSHCWVSVVKTKSPPAYFKFQYKPFEGTWWRLRCFPKTFILGVPKCGTSDLFKRMTSHPEVFRTHKELNFWNRQRGDKRCCIQSFTRWMNNFDEAAIHFLTDKRSTVRNSNDSFHRMIAMDSTPDYFYDYNGWMTVPGNKGLKEPQFLLPHTFYRLFPDMKFVVLFRNPTSRLYSHFRHRTNGYGPNKFHELVVDALKRWEACLDHSTIRRCAYNTSLIPYEFKSPGGILLRAGMYHIFVEDWLKVYPREQFYFIKSEDYYSNMGSVLRDLFSYLGLSPLTGAELGRIHKISPTFVTDKRKYKTKEKIMEKTRVILNQFYAPFNQRLREILGPQFEW